MRVVHSGLAALSVGTALLASALDPGIAAASSHREAPFITELPKVDGTDLYMFRSYEPGREEFVTLIANYQPFQDPFGGPNYYMLDPNALYEIHVDNDGDAREDVTFQFRFDNELKGIALNVGQEEVPIPLINAGPVFTDDTSNLNVIETYTVDVVRGDQRGPAGENAKAAAGNNADRGAQQNITRVGDGGTFEKPVDYIGTKSLPNYTAYARDRIYEVNIPGCTAPAGKQARLFVGQRKESFVINVGQIFDLFNIENPLGDRDQGLNDLDNKNITTLALEVPIACLAASPDQPVIGGWTTASLPQARVLNPNPTFENPTREGGPWTQVSRLGMPLVNEVVIGLPQKNLFNSSEPRNDEQFLTFVTNPTLPQLLASLVPPVVAPNMFPRQDLVSVFLTGVEGVNMTETPAEMMRLNTSIPPTPKGSQNSLGAAQCFDRGELNLDNPGCDPAGFPNGRRPGDDVVDIELRVAIGLLLPESVAPSGDLPLTDGAFVSDEAFDAVFPYLTTPIPGSLP